MADIQHLPVDFGKYKDKSVTELLADRNYTDWLKKQSWFSTKPIYNIVVNQTFNTSTNSKTPNIINYKIYSGGGEFFS